MIYNGGEIQTLVALSYSVFRYLILHWESYMFDLTLFLLNPVIIRASVLFFRLSFVLFSQF